MLLLCLFQLVLHIQAQTNDSADIQVNQDSIIVFHKHQKIAEGYFTKGHARCSIHSNNEQIDGRLFQTIVINADSQVELCGTIYGSDESIACESDPKEGLQFVRHVIGPSHNKRNQAVYERKTDCLISFDDINDKVSIEPEILSASSRLYRFSVKGEEIIIRIKPQFYQKHRGLHYFDPSSYAVWKKPVNGWCSWFAYFDQIDEDKIKHTADVLAQKLKPFGLDYLQIDDGFQQTPIGMPDTWLEPNKKFPSGLQNLSGYISGLGLKPGIWTNVSFADSGAAFRNRSLFVQNKNNEPAKGNWIGYIMDASQKATLDQLIAPVYHHLQQQGWEYFKLDALRHLKYEGYNTYAAYFADKNVNRDDAFRKLVKTVREEIGRENFLLACWGIRPELVGLADGCRIGNDGFSYAGLAQFNSFNNIIWRNDPDHIVLSPQEAYRSCTATSLTGSLFMLTDKPEKYTSPLTEAARRSIPVLYTQPGQVYDVDPSRSARIDMADVEMSGSGPRIFDASTTTTTGLFLLEINKSFENWMVLGRLDNRDAKIIFKDLGLDNTKTYLCFEFWTKKFLGEFRQEFRPGSIDSNFHCQAICIREKLDHPQLLATSRHISCGALELKNVLWKDHALKGISDMTSSDDYTIYIYEPAGYHANKYQCLNGTILVNTKAGQIRSMTIRSSSPSVSWKIDYQ